MGEREGAREKKEEDRESERERDREYPVPGDIGICCFQHFQVPSFFLSIVHIRMHAYTMSFSWHPALAK